MLSHCFPVFIYQLVVSWTCDPIVKLLGCRPTFCFGFAESVPRATVSARKKISALPWEYLCILGVNSHSGTEAININVFLMYAKLEKKKNLNQTFDVG